MNHIAMAAVTIAATLVTMAGPAAAQMKYYARERLPGLQIGGTNGQTKPDACTTPAGYNYATDNWTFLSNVQGTYSEDKTIRVGEVPNVKGWPGAAAICEKAIKGSRRTGCVLLGQPAPGLAIGVFMTAEDRPTTYYVDQNPDFALIATPITCTF